jgi:hypothetical protein
MWKCFGALILFGMLGCSKTVCDQAGDKLSSCNLPSRSTATGNGCDARSQCEANCILNASCADLQAAFTSLQANSYTSCDDGCQHQ